MSDFSRRVQDIASSPTLKLVQLKNQLRAQGKNILDFGAGEPDFATPEAIKEAGIAAIRGDQTRYTTTSGTAELKKAIRLSVAADLGREPADNEIIVSPGSKYGLFLLLLAVVDPGGEVIVPRPYWVSYPEMVRFCGGTAVFADHLHSTQLFEQTAESYISCWTPQTRAVIINSPNNPTGMVMNGDELTKIIRFFAGKDVWVVIDDCYRQILYTDEPYPSPWVLAPEHNGHVAVVSSLSKTYAMTGWRVGYTVGPAALVAAMTKIQEHSTSNPCSISQAAAVEALSGSQESVHKMVAEYRQRRDFFAKRIDAIGGIPYRLPGGAFYFFADFSAPIARKKLAGDNELALDILDKLKLILVPGSSFGAPGYLRISYATSMADLATGLDRLAAYLSS